MEEQATLVTECCQAEIEEDATECPVCGMENPEVVEGEVRLVCENCGYTE
jgi:ribosomal protein S27AE